ncbi:hypothetical protein QJS10_CPA03g00353 [Acorus calamus]|uniref:Trichome birefringence-like C-terminal domain-containing protein n=1 Tax=Acorus calamus TaxID=4465 RepID=A0AAV9F6T2_ACOCL|nr:hypothetical protein QJS10_CPA03g00353 [Acorus calamus]
MPTTSRREIISLTPVRLNGTEFLERMRGKRVIFMGDSMNRSMMQSLVCMLRASLSNTSRVYVDRNKEFEARGYYSFIFEASIRRISPFLVKRVYKGSKEVNLRLDVMDEGTLAIRKSDVAIFNTGHWWNNEKTQGGKNYYQEGNYVHPQLDHMKAFTRALKTWGKWVDHNIDHNKTQEYPKQMQIFEKVSKAMRTPVVYLNTTKLTDFRKDAHVSIYYLERMSPEKEVESLRLQDCGHWCMPGVPDAWNELLYYSLITSGRV